MFAKFFSKQPTSADMARERLKILIAEERGHKGKPSYLPMLEKEILEVIRKYVLVDRDDVRISLDKDGEYEVLELNVLLPDEVDKP